MTVTLNCFQQGTSIFQDKEKKYIFKKSLSNSFENIFTSIPNDTDFDFDNIQVITAVYILRLLAHFYAFFMKSVFIPGNKSNSKIILNIIFFVVVFTQNLKKLLKNYLTLIKQLY